MQTKEMLALVGSIQSESGMLIKGPIHTLITWMLDVRTHIEGVLHMKGIIVIGDMTSHGGVVITGQPNYRVNGRPVACVGDTVTCPIPQHGGVSIIVEGHPTMRVNGRPVALAGHKCACGCTLISTGSPHLHD